MFVEVGGPHHRPHFHAYYQEHVAILGIDPVDLIAGGLPRRQQRLVEAWAVGGGMSHPIHRVRSVEVVGPHAFRVEFDDGTSQTIDLEPVLAGTLYGPLGDPMVFRQVRIDPEVQTLVWPNGADFDPATLHDWPTYREAFARRAREWASEEPEGDVGHGDVKGSR